MYVKVAIFFFLEIFFAKVKSQLYMYIRDHRRDSFVKIFYSFPIPFLESFHYSRIESLHNENDYIRI